MLAMIGAVVFFGAAVVSLFVITQMVRGYWPLITAAISHEPFPRTYALPRHTPRRRSAASAAFTPQRLEPARAAA